MTTISSHLSENRKKVAVGFGLTDQTPWYLLARACFGPDFGSILATFLAVVCNSIHPLASIPAFAMPEAEDQFRIWPSPLIPQSTPRPNV